MQEIQEKRACNIQREKRERERDRRENEVFV
jgi:hypothetical protein